MQNVYNRQSGVVPQEENAIASSSPHSIHPQHNIVASYEEIPAHNTEDNISTRTMYSASVLLSYGGWRYKEHIGSNFGKHYGRGKDDLSPSISTHVSFSSVVDMDKKGVFPTPPSLSSAGSLSCFDTASPSSSTAKDPGEAPELPLHLSRGNLESWPLSFESLPWVLSDKGSMSSFDRSPDTAPLPCDVDALRKTSLNSLPRVTASFSPQNLGATSNQGSLRCQAAPITPFGHPSFFNYLRSLPQQEFLHLARSAARYRRSFHLDSTPSTVISINLCGCQNAHPGPVSSGSFLQSFWTHELPRGAAEHGVYDSFLSIMLVELHADLEVVEFLDRRLPAIVRQRVGNRLDRNFVVQICGISYTREHLTSKWVMGNLTECTQLDLKRLHAHPLYTHMLADLELRSEKPTFRNLNLCPIQFSNRAWPLAVNVPGPPSHAACPLW